MKSPRRHKFERLFRTNCCRQLSRLKQKGKFTKRLFINSLAENEWFSSNFPNYLVTFRQHFSITQRIFHLSNFSSVTFKCQEIFSCLGSISGTVRRKRWKEISNQKSFLLSLSSQKRFWGERISTSRDGWVAIWEIQFSI